MAVDSTNGARSAALSGLNDETQKARFARYFPRAFAYAQSWTNDEARSREVVTEAFARIFNRRTEISDEDFPVALFSITRDLCMGSRQGIRKLNHDLSDPERDVLSLLFDAQLTKEQVGSLLEMPRENVSSTLITGLHKLKRVIGRGSPSLQQS